MLSDLHLHSNFSSDGEAKPEEIIQQAINLKLSYICFTEHSEFDYPEGLFNLDTEKYFETISKLKEKYKNDIHVLIGVEQGLEISKADKIKNFLADHNFDFIIGSSHIVNGIDPYYPSFFKGRTTYDAICEYFSSVLENINTFDNYDVYGHIDYVIRYAINSDTDYCYKKYEEYLEPILRNLISKGKGIEINTGGFRSKINESNPSLEILKKYHEFGGNIITIGSDAHKVTDIAADFDKAANYLKLAGFDYYNVFINRQPIKMELP